MNTKRSKRISQESARAKRLAKANRMTDAEVVAAALSDPDTFLLTAEDLARAVLVIPPQKRKGPSP